MKKKLHKIIENLNTGLIERDEHIKLALLALLANENILLIGPPGTAKSEISRRLSKVLEEGSYFEYLLTKFTTPEEIFGPISIKQLENDIFKRNTDGYISDSNIVFLDEVFKANSSILNALLTILNERLYHNGAIREETSIMSIVGASNELPIGEVELDALYDRFMLKKEVDYVTDTFKLLDIDNTGSEFEVEERLTAIEIKDIVNGSKGIKIPDYIKDKILKIKSDIEREYGKEEAISDRRLVKSIHILKVAAYTSGRDQLSIFDLLLLQNIFWKNPLNYHGIKSIIIKEIMDISHFEKSNIKNIFDKWQKHFNKLYEEQKKDKDGKLLYLMQNGQGTTEQRGEIHLRDNLGNYIFFKGHRDHVKVLSELGKFDHGYIDTGIKTIDKKIVWKYEFSPIKIKTNHTEELEGFERLTVNGLLDPYMIKSYLEYREYYNKNKDELKGLLEDIKRNIITEEELVKGIYENLSERQSYLKDESIDALWISIDQLDGIEELIDSKVEENLNLLKAYEKLANEIEMAME